MFALVMNHEFNDATEFSSFVLESLRLVQWDERIGVAVEDKCRGHVGGYVINGRYLMADDFPDGEVRGVRSEGFDETFGRAAIVQILGGVSEVQQISNRIENRDSLDGTALRVHGVDSHGCARTAACGQHQ